ncbi:MAG: hypothetical protein ACRD1T_13520 [Acidimicrobiia bacterium]
MAFGMVGVAVGSVHDITTVTGEVIDIQCHTKQGEKGIGEAHSECALSCAKKGAALGIKAADAVYTITGDKTKDKNKQLVPFVAKRVVAKGEVTEKDGQKMINVSSIELAKSGT